MLCVHRAPHSQHKIWVCIPSPYNTSQNNHWQCKCTHISFCLYVVTSLFFEPWLEEDSFHDENSRGWSRKPRFSLSSVQFAQRLLRAWIPGESPKPRWGLSNSCTSGKVWCGLLTPHRELTWGGLTDCGSEMLCFATFATILCKTRHLDLALGWQLLWNEFTTPNFKCLSHSFGDWLTNSSSGRQMDEDGCSSFWSELTSPQLLGGAPAPTLEYWVFDKSCQAQCKSMSHPLPVSLLLLR